MGRVHKYSKIVVIVGAAAALTPAVFSLSLCRADQNSAHPEAFWIKRARKLEEQKRGNEAEALYREILRRYPNSADAHYWLGEHFGNKARFDLMEKEMREVARLLPHSDNAQARIAISLLMQSRWADSEAAARRSLKLNGRNGDAWETLGSTFAHRGREKESIAAFKKALSLSPNMVDAYFNLCFHYAEQKQYRLSAQMAEEFIRRHPGKYPSMELELRRELGGLYPLLGEWRKGEDICRSVLRLRPNDGLSHNNLGLALIHSGKRAEARREWQLALRFGGNAETLAEAKAMLAKYP